MAPDSCWCDEGCFDFGDCCPDVCDACPTLSHCGGGGDCGPGEIEDCWGECSPEFSLGDGWCDDAFDCEQFMYDYGDCGGGGDSCEDMCGGSPGTCYCDASCFDYGDCCPDVCDFCDMFPQCGCEPQCDGKECGDDGCYGSCGDCPPGFGCNADFQCEEGFCDWEGEIPDCYGNCGPEIWVGDGICDDGGDFGGIDFNCEEFAWDGGDCEPCVATCEGKACGDDGCGGSCGGCPEGLFCAGYQCTDAFDCGDLYACLINCDDDYNCQDDCINTAPPEVFEQFNAIGMCLEMSGYFECMPDDQACLDAAMAQCQAEMDACFGGALDCPGITECMAGCPAGDSGCFTVCYFSGSPEGEDAYDAMILCIIDTCGDEPTAECWDEAVAGPCLELSAACGVEPCEPDCEGPDGPIECGDDGCGGSCGECGPGFVCEEGACEVFTGDFGAPCESNADCASGWCIDDGQDGAMCTIPCVGDCPEGYECEPLPPPFPETISICQPLPLECEFEECAGWCCAEGEECVDDVCVAP